MKKKSFTLVEVLVGAIILAVSFGGLFAAFVAARAYVDHADQRLVSINLARRFLEDLYDGVGADKWDDSSTELGLKTGEALDSYNIDGVNLSNNTYDVESVNLHAFRKATVTIDLTYADGGAGYEEPE
ncbi:MAG: type II secretion system protein [Candidatus Omnitrophica bacterium]|nr:type II secretion system protein [Candidatus Omnitrophota bacterium]